MKQAKKLKVFGLMTMLISMVFMVSSCSDDDTGGGALSYGKVTGVVTDDLSSPLEGVTVLVDGSGITATPDGPQATTNSQGVYTLENISIGTHIITFMPSKVKVPLEMTAVSSFVRFLPVAS